MTLGQGKNLMLWYFWTSVSMLYEMLTFNLSQQLLTLLWQQSPPLILQMSRLLMGSFGSTTMVYVHV